MTYGERERGRWGGTRSTLDGRDVLKEGKLRCTGRGKSRYTEIAEIETRRNLKSGDRDAQKERRSEVRFARQGVPSQVNQCFLCVKPILLVVSILCVSGLLCCRAERRSSRFSLGEQSCRAPTTATATVPYTPIELYATGKMGGGAVAARRAFMVLTVALPPLLICHHLCPNSADPSTISEFRSLVYKHMHCP